MEIVSNVLFSIRNNVPTGNIIVSKTYLNNFCDILVVEQFLNLNQVFLIIVSQDKIIFYFAQVFQILGKPWKDITTFSPMFPNI